MLQFAREKAALFRTGRVDNPVGFLVSVVPKCLEGEAFAQFRAARALENEEAARRVDEMRREYERILADPASTDEDRRFARRMLG